MYFLVIILYKHFSNNLLLKTFHYGRRLFCGPSNRNGAHPWQSQTSRLRKRLLLAKVSQRNDQICTSGNFMRSFKLIISFMDIGGLAAKALNQYVNSSLPWWRYSGPGAAGFLPIKRPSTLTAAPISCTPLAFMFKVAQCWWQQMPDHKNILNHSDGRGSNIISNTGSKPLRSFRYPHNRGRF